MTRSSGPKHGSAPPMGEGQPDMQGNEPAFDPAPRARAEDDPADAADKDGRGSR